MFECRACVLRCIRAIAGDTLKSRTPIPTRRHLSTTRLLALPRDHRATSTRRKGQDDEVSDKLVQGKQPILETNGTEEATNAKSTDLTVRNQKHLQLELKYLADPVKHAQHVHYTLRQQKPDKALDLCRLASKKQEVIVSWNHCIDWQMQHGKIDAAIKIYNEMKKRAQFPDSYTYVLLLRGLAKPHHHGQPVREANVAKAVSIYNSMSSPTSRVKPSIYHTNAALKVCSAAYDTDALWGIASKLPSSGQGAPDNMTYTILLDAIRFSAFGKDNDEGVHIEQMDARRQSAVQEGRRIWQEIIPKWRAGQISIDEKLVIAMGRLLLMSRRMRDWDDVLELVQQTMNITRLVPALDHPDRHTEHVPQDDFALPEPEAEEDAEGYKDSPSTKAFNVVKPLQPDPAQPDRPTSLAWVQPGNPTLNLLIDACTLLRVPKAAKLYWEHLTQNYNLKPDLDNFNTMLKLLRKNRGSALATTLVSEHMKKAGVEPTVQTIRMAMSVCGRDKNNPNVMSHARSILDTMEATMADLDVHTCAHYLSLALATDDGTKIVDALNRLDPIVHNLRSRINYGTDTQTLSPEAHLRDKEEIIKFLQSLVGTIDTLMNRGLVERQEFQHWHGRRSQLDQAIRRAKNSVEKQRVKLGMESEEQERRRAAAKAKKEDRAGAKGEMQMSRSEWALKSLKMRKRKEAQVEEKRQRAIGLKRWWDGRGGVPGDEGFADSPMELSAR